MKHLRELAKNIILYIKEYREYHSLKYVWCWVSRDVPEDKAKNSRGEQKIIEFIISQEIISFNWLPYRTKKQFFPLVISLYLRTYWLNSPISFFFVDISFAVLVKPPEDLVPMILAAIFGTIAGILLLVLIFVAFTRFKRYVQRKDDELMKTEAERNRIAYELELTKLHISKNNRNLYVPLDVLLDQSGNNYDSEPIYTEIPTGNNTIFG